MSLSQSEGRRGSGATVQDPDGRRRKLREKLLARFESTKQVWDRLAPTVVARERSEQLKEQAAAITRRKQLRLIEEVTETGATRGLGRNSGRLLPAGLERRDLIHLLWRSVEALDLELFVGCVPLPASSGLGRPKALRRSRQRMPPLSLVRRHRTRQLPRRAALVFGC